VREIPPLTLELVSLASLLSPPETADAQPEATFALPPPITA
jgi:hypothetical protein